MAFVDPLFEFESMRGTARRPTSVIPFARLLFDRAEQRLEAERDRLALWMVPGLGSGILFYFSLSNEPTLLFGVCFAAVSALIVALMRGAGRIGLAGALLLLAFSIGFLAAEIRTQVVATPVLAHASAPVRVEGVVLAMDTGRRGLLKGTFSVRHIDGMTVHEQPAKIRVSFRSSQTPLSAGEGYMFRAKLEPPAGPIMPGGYDFALKAFYDGIGGTGFAFSPPQRLNGIDARSATIVIERLREQLAGRIAAHIDGPARGVAIALVTGLRGEIPSESETDLRNAGLYHLISISGVHMSAIALGLFVSLRLILALIPGLALNVSTKKWAAALTLIGTCCYLLFTGSSVPTIRSFVMVALVFLAVIVDRRALTMRNVALAAAIILLTMPESILDPGFQMSFAATAGLIALYESWDRQALAKRGLGRVSTYFAALILSGVVASVATAPFSAFHFQNSTPLGVVSNILAVPITDLIVMPASFAIYVLAPWGWDMPAQWVLGKGCAALLAIAHIVASLPGAAIGVPAGSPSAFLLLVMGGLWVLLWRQSWRWLGVIPALAGIVLWGLGRQPDILIARHAEAIAIRDEAGKLGLLAGRGGSYQVTTWLRRDGFVENAVRHAEGRRCDALGCVAKLAAGGLVAVSQSPESLREDCLKARVVISTSIIRQDCRGPLLVVDRRMLADQGPLAVEIGESNYRIVPLRDRSGQRPWQHPDDQTQYRRISPTSRP